MKKNLFFLTITTLFLSCNSNMQNPLLTESPLPYGAPQFDKIENKHYMPAFEVAMTEVKSQIDAIVNNPDAPTFENTIEALEYAGATLNKVESIFYNVMEAHTNDEMQQIAEELSPKLTEVSMYINLNDKLFQRVKSVYENRASLKLDTDQVKLLEDTYKGFSRSGANLSDKDKETYSGYVEQLSLLTLQFSKNVLASTNAFSMLLTSEDDLAGLPDFVKATAAEAAAAKNEQGWLFNLSAPSYGPFLKYSSRRDLREKMYRAYNSKALGGENDNTDVIKSIVDLRIKISNILGYDTWAEYQTEQRMVKNAKTVTDFLKELIDPAMPVAQESVKELFTYAKAHGFEGDQLMSWDFSYWSEKLRVEKYDLSDEQLKPYFQLESCIDAVFSLANRLYGITFTEMPELPVYHPDVKAYDVKDVDGKHLALFYADFFPRESKRGGAWMTSFQDQKIENGVEQRPFITIVTNFTKPTATTPSLITHDEFTTLLHEFGHALHGMLAQGRYPSQTGTSVVRDFVELPSQIMENWGYEPEFLNTFAKHYETGEVLPQELIDKIVASKNYLSAYYHIRQLQFGTIDMAWHNIKSVPTQSVSEYEKMIYAPLNLLPAVDGTMVSSSFNHIFSGGYSAGYYSYKWAEVLAADAFSLFQENGIFDKATARKFRNLLEKGGSVEADELYREFRGHNPAPEALLRQLDIIK